MARRLVRSREKLIAGVCGGLAEYFHINAPLVRAGFVILALLQGIGFVVYLILLVVLPAPDPQASEGAAGQLAAPPAASSRSLLLRAGGLVVTIAGAVASLVGFISDIKGIWQFAEDMLSSMAGPSARRAQAEGSRESIEPLEPSVASSLARRAPAVERAQDLWETEQRESTGPSRAVASAALRPAVPESSVDVAPSMQLFTVEWVLGPYEYRGLLTLRGDRGSARVEYYEGTIVQDLSFQQLGDGRGAFVGSNVQILAGAAGYQPDAFIVERSGRSGELAFTLACDVAADVCAPLRVLRSAPASSLFR